MTEPYLSGNSYGSEVAAVQIAVGPTAAALGTFFRGARRVNRITVANLDNVTGVTVSLKVQENDDLGSTGWSDVSGASVTVVAGGSDVISIPGVIQKPYARLYGSGSGGSSVCRVTLDDVDMVQTFRTQSPYGLG